MEGMWYVSEDECIEGLKLSNWDYDSASSVLFFTFRRRQKFASTGGQRRHLPLPPLPPPPSEE